MTRGRPEKYSRVFWRWQLFGWLAYGLAMFVAAAQVLAPTAALVNKSVNVGVGFGLSLGLRAIYLRLRERGWQLIRAVPALLAACLAAGAAWSALANTFFWICMGRDLDGMLAGHVFAWTLVHAIVLVAWCAIYVGAVEVDELRRSRSDQPAASETQASPAPLVVRAEGELLRLPQDQIHCIEAARNYSCIVSDAGTHVVRLPLSTLGARLDARSFIRVHRSAIVAVGRLQSLRLLPTQDAVATLAGGRQIRVSRAHRAQVERALASRH